MVLEYAQANCLLCAEEDGVLVDARFHARVSEDAGVTLRWMPLCTIHAQTWAGTAREARQQGAWWACAPEARSPYELTWQPMSVWYVGFRLSGVRVFTWNTQIPPMEGVERAVADMMQHLLRVAGPLVGFETMYKEVLCQL